MFTYTWNVYNLMYHGIAHSKGKTKNQHFNKIKLKLSNNGKTCSKPYIKRKHNQGNTVSYKHNILYILF